MKSPDKALLNLATNSTKLQNRAIGNQQYASADFNSWVQGLFNDYNMENVLDICCGTGNQLAIYAKKNVDDLTGLDISSESIQKAKQRLSDFKGKLTLVSAPMEEHLHNTSSSSKDFISCFYGLYYSRDLEDTCQQIHRILSQKGSLLVCGPYGENNAALFKLLEKYYTLPEFVTYSSSTFMQSTLAVTLEKLEMSLECKYFVNTISYPSADAVMQYLQSTTFFNNKFYQSILDDLNKHFEEHTSFDVDKHVMAIIACKS